ncbi:MAG: YggS family pyridoxal phosphate-dependent enzyme [Conchiformibius sp.]|nr:YggS family pyridoxal phosphate-dependent enzyme [Conchiformibius sp.]
MDLQQNRQAVLHRITSAEKAAGLPENRVRLLAVSKTFPAADIETLYCCGQRDFGENYIQEWAQKADELKIRCPDICWHLIGQIQSNKSRLAAQADWVHTLDSLKLAQRLSSQRGEGLPPLQLCIEINISGLDGRHGITPQALPELAQAVCRLPNLRLRGLMCVASAADTETVRREFQQMQQLFLLLQQIVPDADTLSMGMSGDLETAVACGSTMVRVGGAIFGSRSA